MPVSPVEIDLTAEIAALPRETFTDAAVIGTAETVPPDADFAEVNRYTSVAEVQDDYGEDSDVATAAEAVNEMGADHWFVQVLEEHHVSDETVEDGTEVENTPVHGEVGISTDDYQEVVYVTGAPSDETLEDDELAVNTETGAIATGDGQPATIDYAYVDWTGLERLEDFGVNRAALADVRARREHVGDLDSLVSWATAAGVGVPIGIEDPAEYADYDEAKDAASDVAGYVPAGNIIALTAEDRTQTDIASYVLGQLAVSDPWHDPYFDAENSYPFNVDNIPSRHIGSPGVEETFVGGDGEGDGPTNVVVTVEGANVLWRSVSTAGAASDYEYFDVKMTEIFAASVIERGLVSLRLREDQIPFTADGRSQIESTIRSSLAEYVGGPDDPFAEVDIHVPAFDDLTQDARANRVWENIEIEGRLSGNAHEFALELTVTV